MRRPNRSIEVFDISLMAVVTKAMGAFLVLMLLLVPYYRSGPIGQQEAADLAEKVRQVDKNIQDAINKLTSASADELRKLLEDALRQLAEARKLIAELQHANDALNSQVQRLQKEVETQAAEVEQLKQRIAELERENKALKEELRKAGQMLVAGQMINSDCEGILFTLGIWSVNSYLQSSNGAKNKYVLNTDYFSLGDSDWMPRRVGNNAAFIFGATPNKYMLIVTARGGSGGKSGPLFQAPTKDCGLQVSVQVRNRPGDLQIFPISHQTFKKGEYAMIAGEIEIAEGRASSFKQTDFSPESLAWLKDQLDHIDKAPGQ